MASHQAYQGMFGSTGQLKTKSRLWSAGILLFHIAQNMTLTTAEYFSKIFTYIQFQTPMKWFACRSNLGTSYSRNDDKSDGTSRYLKITRAAYLAWCQSKVSWKVVVLRIVNETRDRHDDAISLCSYTSTYPISLHGVYRGNLSWLSFQNFDSTRKTLPINILKQPRKSVTRRKIFCLYGLEISLCKCL